MHRTGDDDGEPFSQLLAAFAPRQPNRIDVTRRTKTLHEISYGQHFEPVLIVGF
jgi:hypothetical protein